MSAEQPKLVTLGRVSGAFGIAGWLKVESYTRPAGNIVRYPTWILRLATDERVFAVLSGREQSGRVVAHLAGLADRDAALAWRGADILVERERLPPLAAGEYYWTDLEGLEVRALSGEVLGRVDHLLTAGGHDVLVVRGGKEALVPFVLGRVVQDVDLEGRVIVVDWSGDY